MGFIVRILGVLVGLVLLGIGGVAVWGWAPDIPHEELALTYASESSQFVELPSGVTVHMRDEGCSDCPAVFLIHGSNASLHTWEFWREELEQDWRIVRFDMPGHGLTGATQEADYSIERAASLIEEMRQYLDIDRMHLAGNSRGGRISLVYAVDHPERLLSLSLLNATGAPWPEPDPDAETEDEPVIYQLMANPMVAQSLKNFLPRSFLEEGIRNAFSDQDKVTDAMIDRYHDLLRHPGNREATLLRADMPYTTEAYDNASVLADVPVMVMWGDEDNLVPLSLSERYLEAMPHSQLIVYPGVGHAPMEEVADQSAADFEAFLLSSNASASSDDFPDHVEGQALFGYYMPSPEVRVGDWVLSHMFIDDASFADVWTEETGEAYFAPVMFEFDDTSSPMGINELGGEYYENGTRALPTRFAVTANTVSFEGHAEGLGAVTFHGSYDRSVVLVGQGIGATEEIAIEGRLQIGDQVFEDVQFSWFGGD